MVRSGKTNGRYLIKILFFIRFYSVLKEPCGEKTCLWGFHSDSTQTGLYNHRRWQEAWDFGSRKYRDCSICVAKTKALISWVVTGFLGICKRQSFS